MTSYILHRLCQPIFVLKEKNSSSSVILAVIIATTMSYALSFMVMQLVTGLVGRIILWLHYFLMLIGCVAQTETDVKLPSVEKTTANVYTYTYKSS